MVWSVHEVSRYNKIHIKYNILIFGKWPYPASLWSQWCRISQILLWLNNITKSESSKMKGISLSN
jgi:hypothetical protein